jgi:Caspase domain
MKSSHTKHKCFLVGFGLTILLICTLNAAQPVPGKQESLSGLRRIALVIGNNAYKYPDAKLQKSVNDATDMKTTLGDFGFQVDLELDADYQRMQSAINKFILKLGPQTIGLFYYAGHGMQIEGENYLIPVDFILKDEATAKQNSYSASLLNERMEAAKSKLNIIILDACRKNPFRTERLLMQGANGLALMNAGEGTYIAFATGPNRTAIELGNDRNGLFTKHLLQSLKQSPTCLNEVFDRTRIAVYQASGARQIPWAATNVIGTFCFRESELTSHSPPTSTEDCKGRSPGDVSSFSLEQDYSPSGIMGDIDDVQILPGVGSYIFEYTTKGKGPHEWNYKYVNGQLNPRPAAFGGVFYLTPPNNFGTVCGGVDLSEFRHLKWDARSLSDEVYVEFIIGGINWIWDEIAKKPVEPKYKEKLPRISLGFKRLTSQWQTFDADLSKRPSPELSRVLNAFSWVVPWSANGVRFNEDHTGPDQQKTFRFEIKNVRYEK